MLSGVLNSPRAVQANIMIMRAFVQFRYLLETNRELAEKLNELEKSYDKKFTVVFTALRALMKRPDKEERRIGFKVSTDEEME